MKNILSENMLRFGVKNLSESNKKRLTLESILKTIEEHGLTEEVKDFLNEQTSVTIRGLMPSITKKLSKDSAVESWGGTWNYPVNNNVSYWRNQNSKSRVNITSLGKGMLELDIVDLGFKLKYKCGSNGATAEPGYIYNPQKFADSGVVSAADNFKGNAQVAKQAANDWDKSARMQGWGGGFIVYGAKEAFAQACAV